MKTVFGAVVVAGGLLGAASASAVPTTLIDVENVDTWLTQWHTTSWTHQFTFDPVAASIYDATLQIGIWDDENGLWADFIYPEVAIGGIVDSWQVTVGEVDSGTYAFDIDVGQVSDGSLGVWVTSLWGDFKILTSTLTINYEPGTAPVSVPEPDTLALLGLSLLGLGFVSRRRLAKSAQNA